MAFEIDPRVLREYDIRGVVGAGLDEATAHAVGRAFATRVRNAGGRRVAVARDGRLSSPMLEAALVAGLAASGVEVVRLGLGPSPMLYWAEATLAVDAGVQVTGSHNPGDQNGFKFVLGTRPFFGGDLRDLARIAAAGAWREGVGTIEEGDVLDAYVSHLARGFPDAELRIAWDAGNGAAGPAIERLVGRLSGEHRLLHTAVDGAFPNHHPDPTIEANLADLKACVLAEGLDLGVAFDGDGDRIGAVDARGRTVWGDQILAVLAEVVLADLPACAVVADVKASQGLFDRIAELGGRPVMWKSGHSNIKERMRRVRAPLGGEMSGHVFFGPPLGHGYDDALRAAVMLAGAVARAGVSLGELVDRLPRTAATPELRFRVERARAREVVAEVLERLHERRADVDETDGVRVREADGWWLLRASNTEDVLTARAEGADEAALARLVARIDAELATSGVTRA